jgi:hypothetical protein
VSPFDELDASASADEPEPSAEERSLPLVEDDPEGANGMNADNDNDDQPAADDETGSGS